MYKTKKDLADAATNLKFDFNMVISFIKTSDDLEVVSKAITKAFECVPNAQELPSVDAKAKETQKVVEGKLRDFLSQLPED